MVILIVALSMCTPAAAATAAGHVDQTNSICCLFTPEGPLLVLDHIMLTNIVRHVPALSCYLPSERIFSLGKLLLDTAERGQRHNHYAAFNDEAIPSVWLVDVLRSVTSD